MKNFLGCSLQQRAMFLILAERNSAVPSGKYCCQATLPIPFSPDLKKKKILGISKKYKTGYLKIKIWVNFSEAFGKLRKRKTWDGFPFVGIAASSCWAGKWNRFVIVLAEQPSLISNWDLRDLHKYLTVSKEMLTKPPRWISKEFNNKKKKSHLQKFPFKSI